MGAIVAGSGNGCWPFSDIVTTCKGKKGHKEPRGIIAGLQNHANNVSGEILPHRRHRVALREPCASWRLLVDRREAARIHFPSGKGRLAWLSRRRGNRANPDSGRNEWRLPVCMVDAGADGRCSGASLSSWRALESDR